MRYSQQTISDVRQAYVEGLSLKMAAEKYNVPYETARNWKRKAQAAGQSWLDARAAFVLSAQGEDSIASSVVDVFGRIWKDAANEVKEDKSLSTAERVEQLAKLAGSMNQVRATMKGTFNKQNVMAARMEAVQLITDIVTKEFPDQLQEWSLVLKMARERLADV